MTFAVVSAALGSALLIAGWRDWPTRLLALAAGTFAAAALPGLAPAGLAALRVASMVAFALALLLYPRSRPGRGEVPAVAAGAAALGAAAAFALPPALGEAVLFSAALPGVGFVLLRPRGRDDLAGADRARIRLLRAALVTALVVELAWAATRRLPATGLAPVALAAAALAAGRRDHLDAVQRRSRLALPVVQVAALVGGLVVLGHPVLGPASAAVALLFRPIHVRAERWTDRLLYGPRPAPYRVLASIGELTAPDLAQVAEVVGRGLGARVCRLTVHRPGRPDRTYAWGADDSQALVTRPIVHGDEQLGQITVDRLNAQRHRLFEDLADSLGPVLEARRLSIERERHLRAAHAHAAEIAASRRRLVAEMDAERRRVERDLHDGAQHHLVSLRLALGLAEHRLTTGRPADADAALGRVAAQLDELDSIMTRTAVGVTSPVLAQHGLVAALSAEFDDVTVATSGLPAGQRFPAELESAVWFCCLEAVTNARKHAPGATVEVVLSRGPERLEFGVHDDGPGWDMTAAGRSPGRGTRNVTARVTAAGGAVSVTSAPGSGTRVDGWVPLPADGEPSLLAAAREVIASALTEYRESAAIRRIAAGLEADRPKRREAVRAAGAALRALDAAIRADPPASGGDALRHRLDRLLSGTHELDEVAALDELGSHPAELGSDEAEAAARLLGGSGADARSRLGLAPDAEAARVAAAAAAALAVWRGKASHPGTAPAVRSLAATVVRSCEQLIADR